jgi:DNA-binding Xre family transcriptional regulator
MLTKDQLDTLRSAPLSGQRNKLRIAIAMAAVRQLDVAEATGITQANLSEIVNGKYGAITLETTRKLSGFFGCAIEDLFPAAVRRNGEAA